MTALTAARSSLRVKYQCPEAAWVKLETSPRTHSNGMLHSNNCPTAWLSWATDRICPVKSSCVNANAVDIRLPGQAAVHRTGGAGFGLQCSTFLGKRCQAA